MIEYKIVVIGKPDQSEVTAIHQFANGIVSWSRAKELLDWWKECRPDLDFRILTESKDV